MIRFWTRLERAFEDPLIVVKIEEWKMAKHRKHKLSASTMKKDAQRLKKIGKELEQIGRNVEGFVRPGGTLSKTRMGTIGDSNKT